MALSVAAVGSLGNAKTGTNYAPGVPAGVASGTLVCAAVMGYATTLTTAPTITGFTAGPVSASALNAFGFQFKIWWFYKYATGADTGTYTGTMASGNAMMAYAFTLAGWTPTSGSPYVDSLHEAVTNGGTAAVASFTPAANATLLLGIHLDSGANFPAGWTKSANATDLDGDTITLSYLYQATAAATGSITFGNVDGTVVSVASMRLPSGGSQFPVTGTVAAVSAVHGAVTVRRPIAGSAHGVSGSAGAAAVRHPVTGSVHGASSTAGAVTVRRPVVGTVAASTAAHATVTARLSVAGSTHASSGAAGAVQRSQPVTGHAAALSAVSGAVTVIPAGGFAVSGTVTATSSTVGTIGLRAAVAGHVAAVSAVTGSVSLVPHQPLAVSGTVAATSAVHGAVTVRRAVVGTVQAVSAVHGATTARLAMAGTVAAVSAVRATATARLTIAGTVNAVSTVHGTVSSSTDVIRDITLTATPLPGRWSIAPSGVRWSTAPTPDRWETTCLQQ